MHKIKTTIIISIILLSLLTCLLYYGFKKNEKKSAVGNYESLSPTLFEKAKFAIAGIECFYAGRKLALSADSTFVFIDNNNCLTGLWHQKKGQIKLHFLSNKYLSDSLLNKSENPKVPLEDYFLEWNNSDLYGSLFMSGENCAEVFRPKS